MERNLIGYVSVDSAQLFIIDPCYLETWQHGDYDDTKDMNNSYDRVTKFMFDNGDGEVEKGVVISLEDDGDYPVYVTEDEKGIIKVEIVFRPGTT